MNLENLFIYVFLCSYLLFVGYTIMDAHKRKKDRHLACLSVIVPLLGLITIPLYWYRKRMEATQNG